MAYKNNQHVTKMDNIRTFAYNMIKSLYYGNSTKTIYSKIIFVYKSENITGKFRL